MSARLAAVGQDRKLYLVAKGLGTDQPPETIYQLYLGLPQGTAPNPNGPYYVGALNFFNAVRRGAEAGQPDPRFLSFEVTSLLKTLRTGNALGDNATVTIVPAASPCASARPVIAEIAPRRAIGAIRRPKGTATDNLNDQLKIVFCCADTLHAIGSRAIAFHHIGGR